MLTVEKSMRSSLRYFFHIISFLPTDIMNKICILFQILTSHLYRKNIKRNNEKLTQKNLIDAGKQLLPNHFCSCTSQ